MKKIFAAIMFFMILGSVVFAQPKPPKSPMHKMDPEKMLIELKHKLELNDDQFREIKTLLFNAEKELIDLRSGKLEEKMEMMEKHKSIMDDTEEKIADLLDESQLAKFEKMKAEHKKMNPPHHPKN